MFVKLRALSELHKQLTQQLRNPHIRTYNRDYKVTVHRCYSEKYSVYGDKEHDSNKDRADVANKNGPQFAK